MDELGIDFEFYEIRRGGHSDVLITGVPYVFDFFDKHIKPMTMEAGAVHSPGADSAGVEEDINRPQ